MARLGPDSFEHMANALAERELGFPVTTFAPGPDAGRDAYFEGKAPYPTKANSWSGRWYIQSKFHDPDAVKNPQNWLVQKIKEELAAFASSDSRRTWPDNWIVITNVNPSGHAETGAFDRAMAAVAAARPQLARRFHIWGGNRVLELLDKHQSVAERYGDFLTAGHVLAALRHALADASADVESIIRAFIVKPFSSQAYAKLEQVDVKKDERLALHHAFVDLRFSAYADHGDKAMKTLMRAAAQSHRPIGLSASERWTSWRRRPQRARVWFVRGGPGQGKSTLAQYFAQIQRAALIVQEDLPVSTDKEVLVREIERAAKKARFWPHFPRIPIYVELHKYATWYAEESGKRDDRGVLAYVASLIQGMTHQPALVGTLKRALAQRGWFIAFDGLDEVPHDVKNEVATNVREFVNEDLLDVKADALILCTTRPQGYSGQFSGLEAASVELSALSPEEAIECAVPVLSFQRDEDDAERDVRTLRSAIGSPAVRELMRTPLQAHIMAVVVRGGRKPPDRRWELFRTFYRIIYEREAERELPKNIKELFRSRRYLIKTVHDRVGFALHALAETSNGGVDGLPRPVFEQIVRAAVKAKLELDLDAAVAAVREATIERLVLVNTPHDANHLRYDIRQLQEFFAAEFLYDCSTDKLRERMLLLGGDVHWREVVHFILSAFLEEHRHAELTFAIELLTEIDGRRIDLPNALLRGGLCRGALIVARVLAEGVAEEDRDLREALRRAVEPVFASTETATIASLIETPHPNTAQWLTKTLSDHCRKAAAAEQPGAIAALAFLLSDDDPAVATVRDVIGAADASLLALAARIVLELAKRFGTCRQWFVAIVASAVADQRWQRMSITTAESMLAFLRMHWGLIRSMFEDEARALFEWLLAPETKTPSPSGSHGGLLRVLAIIARHAGSSTEASRRAVRELVGTEGERLSVLTPEIRSLIRAGRGGKPRAGAHRDESWAIAERARDEGSLPQHVLANEWLSILTETPDVALRIWQREAWKGEDDVNFVTHRAAFGPLLAALLANPMHLIAAPGIWSTLYARSGGNAELRGAMVKGAASRVVPIAADDFQAYNFALSFPHEAVLLPHLVTAMMGAARRIRAKGRQDAAWQRMQNAADDLAPDLEALLAVIDDRRRPKRERMAAWLLAIILRGPQDSIRPLRDFYDAQEAYWFVPAVGAHCLTLTGGGRKIVHASIEEVLELSRNDFDHRDRLNDVFASWRETSEAPLAHRRAAAKWLDIPTLSSHP